MANQIISHLYQDSNGEWIVQTNEAHCNGVAGLASEFASEFGMADWGRLAGLLHDRGKERPGFQAYIRRSSGYDVAAKSADSKDHSFVGAKLVNDSHGRSYDGLYFLSNIIAGHHRGLYDIFELQKILESEVPDGVSKEMPTVVPENPPRINREDASHFTRMLYSCLVDADWLDTERFMNPTAFDRRKQEASIEQLRERLEEFCSGFKDSRGSELNRLRSEIQELCRMEQSDRSGFFDLTVPTGGGKTIASVVWAINHALRAGKRRIIVAIPFTSIIVQTAETLRRIFGSENVVEHHSAIDENNVSEFNRLASENWDAPIIVTTNVQLFESMFSNKPSKCRKLHSICNSVVILDEAQSLPQSLLQPIVDAMQTYVDFFGVSFLLCTASQPTLDGMHKGSGPNNVFNGIPADRIKHIIPDSMQLHDSLRRVNLSFDIEPKPYEEVARMISRHDQALCVVNTKRHARMLFNSLPAEEGVRLFHLSRMMCPAHILDVINEIKRCLQESMKVRVVATQLIEAGVDIDFPVVFRQIAGLDSILQAAGRCNREGRLPVSTATVFQFDNDKPMGAIGRGVNVMSDMLSLCPDSDWFAPETMRTYCSRCYSMVPSFDKNRIGEKSESPRSVRYEEIARLFRMIEDEGSPVIVNYGDAARLVEKLRFAGPSRALLRQLGRYSVTLHQSQINELRKGGLIEEPREGFLYIPLESQYDLSTGLRTDNDYREMTMIL